MTTLIKLTLRVEDAEPILREAAYEAARYSALCDYITRRTVNAPEQGFGEAFELAQKRWREKFVRAKRIVNAFGFEYDPTSAEETLTIYWPPKKGTGTEFVPDYKNPLPCYRREIHSQACHAAAERVVRAWRQSLAQAQMAA